MQKTGEWGSGTQYYIWYFHKKYRRKSIALQKYPIIVLPSLQNPYALE